MIPRSELLKIALTYSENHGTYLIDENEIPCYRIGFDTNLVGRFIPISSYYSFDSIESMTTYDMRDIGIFSDEDLIFINEMSHVSVYEDIEWVEIIKDKIDDEL